VKPGIYNLYLASQADKTKTHDGVILHADRDSVFQQVGKSVVKHDRVDFLKAPAIGRLPMSLTLAAKHRMPEWPIPNLLPAVGRQSAIETDGEDSSPKPTWRINRKQSYGWGCQFPRLVDRYASGSSQWV
jgi:hypothetical protein